MPCPGLLFRSRPTAIWPMSSAGTVERWYVGAVSEYKRFYPESNLAGSVVGLAGTDGQGLSGVELQYDRMVRGAPVE